jgi:hypothetical protein
MARKPADEKAAPSPKSGRAPTAAEMKATTDNVTVLAITNLKKSFTDQLVAINDNDKQGESLGQGLTLLCMKHWAAEQGSNSRPSVRWSEMVKADRTLTDAGLDWIKRCKEDELPDFISRKKNETHEQLVERQKNNADHQRVDRACRLAIAIGANNGTIADYDPKLNMFKVSVEAFRPFVPNGHKKIKPWIFPYGETGKVLLSGAGSIISRKGATLTAKDEIVNIRFNVSQALRSYFKTPEHLAKPVVTGNGEGKKGPDEMPGGKLTREERQKEINAMPFLDWLGSFAGWQAAHKSDEPITLAQVRADKTAFNVLTDLVRFYRDGKAAEEAAKLSKAS